MGERKHTPGGWAIGYPDNNRSRPIIQSGADNMAAAGRVLAWVSAPLFPQNHGETRDEYRARHDVERDANAALIASAPDLLEALEEAETWMFRVSDEILDGEGSRPQYIACRERIRAAIARAQGKG